MARVQFPAVVIAATPWYDSALDSLPRIAEIFTALLGAIALAGVVRSVYRRTFGRRRDRYERLRRLGTNAQLSFFSSVLGEPPAMERTLVSDVTRYDDQGTPFAEARTFKEAVWIDRDFYIHAIADEDQTVHAYSVTTRSKRFHPTYRVPGGSARDPNWFWRLFGKEYLFKPNPAVKLGKTRFAELGRPGQAAVWIGMHNWHYFEPYSYGNPGLYQNFVFSINDEGVGIPDFPSHWVMEGFSWGFFDEPLDANLALIEAAIEADRDEAESPPSLPEPEPEPEADKFDHELGIAEVEDPPLPPDLKAFRRRARINTYTVIGPDLALDDYPLAEGSRLDQYPVTFGVTSYRVRTLG